MMSRYYNIRTKATIKDVSGSNDLHIDQTADENYWYIRDNYKNVISCITDDEGRIVRISRNGGDEVTYILYKLVVDYESLLLDEYSDLEMMHDAVKLNDQTYFVDYGNSYEDFTSSMLRYLRDDIHSDRYDLSKVDLRLYEILSQIDTKENVQLVNVEDVFIRESQYFKVSSEVAVFDLAKNHGILITKDNMEDDLYWIKDRYEGVIECNTRSDGTIEYLVPREQEPWYVLYVLASKHKAKFVDKETHIGIFDDAKDKGPDENGNYEFAIQPAYENYTMRFNQFIIEEGLEIEYKL